MRELGIEYDELPGLAYTGDELKSQVALLTDQQLLDVDEDECHSWRTAGDMHEAQEKDVLVPVREGGCGLSEAVNGVCDAVFTPVIIKLVQRWESAGVALDAQHQRADLIADMTTLFKKTLESAIQTEELEVATSVKEKKVEISFGKHELEMLMKKLRPELESLKTKLIQP